MEAAGFADADGDEHECSDWQIVAAEPTPRGHARGEVAWEATCATLPFEAAHPPSATESSSPTTCYPIWTMTRSYRVRVRFIDSAGEAGPWSERRFRTDPPGPPGKPSKVPWAVRQKGFKVERVAGGLRLPVNIAMVPHPKPGPRAPLLYVTELSGKIKLVRRNGRVTTYARGLLNFKLPETP